MKYLQWIALFGGMLLAAPAYATAAPDTSTFELYGNAFEGSDITAIWKGKVVSVSEVNNGRFRLVLPMGMYMPYHSGDKIEIDVNNKRLRMVTIGKAGTSRQIVLYKK